MPYTYKDIFNICEISSKIHFITEVNELIDKSSGFLKKLGFQIEESENILTIQCDNPKEFFEENFDFLNTNFNILEKEVIKIFIENENNKLTLNSILSTKKLKKYLHFIEDKNFFEIIKENSLTTHFQAIVDMNTNKTFAYETLTRGVLPNGELMYPDDLFSKSAKNDMNFVFDRMCRETALKQVL
jgi:hypothetical protein